MKRLLLIVVAILIAVDARAAVEGYVWPLSAAPGETIAFYVSGAMMPNDPDQANVVFSRVSSNPTGVLFAEPAPTDGISVTSTADLPVGAYPDRDGPSWPLSGTFTIPADWPTGYYIATLKAAPGGADYRVTFVVKPAPAERHRTAILANINTWNAYNNWQGRFKYNNYPVTSFMRPNPSADLAVGLAAPLFPGTHLAHAEVWLLTAIESYLGRGRADVYSDLDFHNGLVKAGSHGGEYDRLILSTHPEYWTTQMYDNLRAFLDKGGVVLYLGGNGIFEIGSYSTNAGGAAMTFLNGQEAPPDDGADPALRIAAMFRTHPPRAERALLGIATAACEGPYTGQPYTVLEHPPAGSYERGIYDAILTGVVEPADVDRTIGANGVLSGASGHEVDRVAKVEDGSVMNQPTSCGLPLPIVEVDTTPAGVVKLAVGGPIQGGPGADMTYYPYPNPPGPDPGGGYVFGVGSVNFGQSLLVDPKLRVLMDNVLCSGRLNASHPVKSSSSAGPRNRGECVANGAKIEQLKSPSASMSPQ